MASHYPEAIPLQRHTAEDVANALSQIFSHFGFPKEILSDQAPDFMSELMQRFTHQFGVSQLRCSTYHPETNGSCERFHRTLKTMIRSMVNDFEGAWDESLPWLLFAYREIAVETLGFSPFELLFGRLVRGPLALFKSTWLKAGDSKFPPKTKPNVIQYLMSLRERLTKCSELALKTAENARTRSKIWYDK